jgi:hypothetical protein
MPGRAVLDDRAQLFVGLVGQDVEGAVAGPVSRDLGGAQPLTAGEGEQVVLWPNLTVVPLQQ